MNAKEARENAEEDYMKVPISVLRYISELENAPFCPYCGTKKEHKLSTDINSDLVCKNILCRGI